MPAEEVVRARIDKQVKADASAVLEAMGLSMSDAIRLLLVRIAKDKALPFAVKVPNCDDGGDVRGDRPGRGHRALQAYRRSVRQAGSVSAGAELYQPFREGPGVGEETGQGREAKLGCDLYVFNLALWLWWRNAIFSQTLQMKRDGFSDDLLYFLHG